MALSRPVYVYTGTEWVPIGPQTSYITSRWTKTMSGGETSLSGTDNNSVSLSYDVGYEQVYLNGVLLVRGVDYVATTGTTITGLTALAASDVVEVMTFRATEIAGTYAVAEADDKFLSKVSASTIYASLSSNQTLTGNVSFTGRTDVQEIRETVVDGTIAANVLTADYTTGAIFFVGTSPSANFTLNMTNMPTDNGTAITIVVMVTQGATGYIPNAVQIGGVSQTLKWLGGTPPTPTSSSGKIDIFNFTFVRRSSAWTVMGNTSLNY